MPKNEDMDIVLELDHVSIWTQAEAYAQADPNFTALIDLEGRIWSRMELVEQARAIGDRLRERGRGLRYAATAHKSAQTVVIALAVSYAEGIFCPISPFATSQDRAVLFAELGLAAFLEFSAEGELQCTEFPEIGYSRDPRDKATALIGFTSGTTGVPKGVMHGSAALNYVTSACARNAGLLPGEAILGIMNVDSAAGFVFTIHFAVRNGSPLVFTGRWDALDVMEKAVLHDCRWTTGVPTHLLGMVEATRSGAWKGGSLPLRAFAVGGAPMHESLIGDARTTLGIDALRMFGLSEVLAPCSNRLSEPMVRRENYDGIANPGCELAAFDPRGVRLAPGLRGEAGVRGPSMFLGYAKGLADGEERFTPGGFLLTGDEIVVDEAGYVRVVGRFKDQIIRGGLNIDPAEIERALALHPAVAEVAVIGLQDDKLGERACAVCRLMPFAEPMTLSILHGHLADVGVSKRKWPEEVHLLTELPHLPSGKVDKRSLRLDFDRSRARAI